MSTQMPHGPLMVDIAGKILTETEIEILKSPYVGSVILSTKNYDKPEQLKKLIQDIRKIRPNIIITVDHEGGLVQRFKMNGFRTWPAARVYGDVYNLNKEAGLALVEKYGRDIALELAALDIDVNLAPVEDTHTDSDVIGKWDRAFHESPEVCAELGERFIRGMKKVGVAAALKHFPNHGICKGDSHVTNPVSDIDLKTLSENHMLSFQEIIESGQKIAVMDAHIKFTKIDDKNTVGLSKVWNQEILRDQMKFKGPIMTDCISMKGVDDKPRPMQDVTKDALGAGCDMVIICNQDRKVLLEVINALQASDYKQSAESQARIATLQRDKKAYEPALREFQAEEKAQQEKNAMMRAGYQRKSKVLTFTAQGSNANKATIDANATPNAANANLDASKKATTKASA